ncbi:MAG TPA: adenylate/guanylate cyclase domain-containing protein [Actinomycetota bacterium]|nr:adenylate/guanylate cyclase domain-containing protein [Actinomycetota bacterium]
MTELPTGTVTFLFTDIEGSTNLARTLGERWPEVLEAHHQILGRAIEAQRGVTVRTEGDAFFAVFPSAVDAVVATVQAQRGLATHPWPADGMIRVRMGLHTGEGRLSAGDYAGLDVHQAARIAAAGHGGQVLLSDATAALVATALPDGVSIGDLGHHRLKDFDEPQRITQLVIDGLAHDFPPLKTLDVNVNLPVQLTTFVGRDQQLSDLLALLGEARLVSLIGPGGTGKTRLAIEVASRSVDDFADGVFFVDLAPIRDPELVPSSIIQSLGVKEQSERPGMETVTRHLADRRALLLMDNFEQVISAASVVDGILRGAAQVRVMATSRMRLNLAGERTFPVPPLGLPDEGSDPETLSRNEAVALFRDRARAVLPAFDVTEQNARDVATLCARLDGLPLAIELAAAQIRLLSPAEVLARLERHLPLRSDATNVPERQRTLRGAIEWSYELLDEPHRRLFARMSVFAGGGTMAAIETVCNPDGDLGVDTLDAVSALFDASLLRREDDADGSRFVMLETIREYAGEQLESAFDADDTRRRHAEFATALVEEWAPRVRDPQSINATGRLTRDLDNIRSAIDWCVERGAADLGLRIVAPMWMYWVERGLMTEGLRAVEAVLSLSPGLAPRTDRAAAMLAHGGLLYWQSDYEAAARVYEEALREYRAAGDDEGAMRAGNDMMYALLAQRRWQDALPMIEDQIERAGDSGNDGFMAELLGLLGIAALQRGDNEGALEAYSRSLELFQRAKPGHPMVVWVGEAKGRVGSALRALGRLDEAEESILDGLRTGRLLAGNLAGVAIGRQLGALEWDRRNYERALVLFAFSEMTAERIGGPPPEHLIAVEEPAHFRAEARQHLDDATIDRLWRQGRAMSLDEGIEFMLQGK